MKLAKYIIVSVLVFIILAAAVGCGSSGTPASPSPSAQTSSSAAPVSAETGQSVIMQNRAFSPAEISIKKGETVTWTNGESSVHNVVSVTFKSDTMKKGDTFSYTFNETGTFDYTCTFHPGMDGKVIVK